MRACKVDEQQLATWIDGSTGAIRYLAPAITERLARKLVEAQRRTGECNCVVIELHDEVERSGYGRTAGVRILHDKGIYTRHRAGLRVAAFTAPGIGAVWSPVAERVDPMENVSVNGICMEGPELRELQCWMERMMGEQAPEQPASQDEHSRTCLSATKATNHSSAPGEEVVNQDDPSPVVLPELTDDSEVVEESLAPAEPEVKLSAVNDEKIKKVETHLKEHPPRDFKKEKQTEIYQGYVGFVEIQVEGGGLSGATTLAIPKELTELGLATDLRTKLSERMRIDLTGSVDLGASDVNRRVDAFREIFTRQMGPPLGRIYKKSDWQIMQTKWAEIECLVDAANEKIMLHMHTTVEKEIRNAARDWKKAIDENPIIERQVPYTVEYISRLLFAQWGRRQRATRVRVKLFAKDLTWDTLNDQDVREKIEEAYPDIRKTGMYKSWAAWTS